MERYLVPIYLIGDAATFIYLIYKDFPDFNGWNWIFIIPLDMIVAQVWPVYWAILHWVF
ncbi:hypothetical protein [Oceanicola sp. S124]|uniref:hypothetical protein n=1 Tax=Oceanicola sp. S124 TaxID=1042378 RepID=UPI00143ABA65|nr:hypothetical protein [Oceanicola sp. S124]